MVMTNRLESLAAGVENLKNTDMKTSRVLLSVHKELRARQLSNESDALSNDKKKSAKTPSSIMN
jgi:hypothetical protein